ncbi:hypothetical protein [Flagellimonas meridianipacifica]|uniref:CD-NTase-associated protein 16 NUDIX domain-containing protein n=1 Tax=Flagellimonas meridianipacifica TaxID=1080225 RepID=A0A2T0MIW4_9FLAO|nr:hypothetical protein [Allomuricauda pacifica]PRX57528.1 hypothetical protein CLV81_1533 [Allomuricauda pacifica]
MSSESKRFFGYTIVFLVASGYLIYRYSFLNHVSDFHKETLVGLALGAITTCIVGIYETIKSHGKYFWTAVRCALVLPNKKVYVSLSYLLRIKLPGAEKYFLIKGSKIDQYQPVGGVYQLVGNKDIYKDWKASPKADIDNPKDLRFFVSAKYIPKIIEWFKSGKDREIGIWREFYEELVETEIISKENFQTIRAEFLKSKEEILIKETRFTDESFHLRIFNIYQIELTSEQLEEIRQLHDKKPITKKYAFVSKDEIEKECFDGHKRRIGNHTKHII